MWKTLQMFNNVIYMRIMKEYRNETVYSVTVELIELEISIFLIRFN